MNRLKQLRQEKGINQEVLAKILGLEIAGISKLETERVPLKDEYIIKLSDYFGVSTDYLLGKSDIRNYNDINFSKEDIDFARKIKPLSEEHKMILKKFIDTLNEQK